MTALVILAVVVLALVLLGQIRLGAVVDYAAQGFRLRVRVGPLRIQAYPRPPKPEKRKKPKKKKAEPDKPQEKGGTIAQIKTYLPLITEAAGRLKRKIRIDEFTLDFTAAAADPASAALLFGGANAAVGMIWPLVEQNFNVKERDIRTRVDFTAQRPEVALSATATLTAAQALSLAFRLTMRFLKIQSQSNSGAKAPARQKEAV